MLGRFCLGLRSGTSMNNSLEMFLDMASAACGTDIFKISWCTGNKRKNGKVRK